MAFGIEHGRDRIAAALADDDNDLTLAVLVDGETAIDALLLEVGGLHVAAEVAAVHLSRLAFQYNTELPESNQVFAVVAAFFDRQLGR